MTTGLPGPDAASSSRNPPLNYYGELVWRQEVDAEQQERLGDPPGEEGRS